MAPANAAAASAKTKAVPIKPAWKPRPKAKSASTPAEQEAAREAATRTGAGDIAGAIQIWTKLIETSSNKVTAYLERAKLIRLMGDQKSACDDLDAALKISPNNLACLTERAALRKRMSDLKGALEDLNKIIELKPTVAESYNDRGWVKMALGDYVGSYSDYHTAVRLNPALKSKMGNLLQPQVGTRIDSEPTLNKIEKAPEKDDSQPQTGQGSATAHGRGQGRLARLNNAAVKQINERQFEDAIRTLGELISAAPEYAHARDNLTIAHNNWGLELAKRSPADAAREFRHAVYLDPSQGASRRNLDAMIREIGKNPKDADDRLAMANDCQSAGDYTGAFVEATEAARLKNSPAVRTVLKKSLLAIEAKESRSASEAREKSDLACEADGKDDDSKWRRQARESRETRESREARERREERLSHQDATVLGQLKPVVKLVSVPARVDAQSQEMAPQTVIDQARALAQSGHEGEAEELLQNLISHIKGRAAIDESAGFDMLDQALDTLAEIDLKAGKFEDAQTNLSELIMLRESARDHADPLLGTTYRQYAKVLSALNRDSEAKIYQDKADAIKGVQAARQ